MEYKATCPFGNICIPKLTPHLGRKDFVWRPKKYQPSIILYLTYMLGMRNLAEVFFLALSYRLKNSSLDCLNKVSIVTAWHYKKFKINFEYLSKEDAYLRMADTAVSPYNIHFHFLSLKNKTKWNKTNNTSIFLVMSLYSCCRNFQGRLAPFWMRFSLIWWYDTSCEWLRIWWVVQFCLRILTAKSRNMKMRLSQIGVLCF